RHADHQADEVPLADQDERIPGESQYSLILLAAFGEWLDHVRRAQLPRLAWQRQLVGPGVTARDPQRDDDARAENRQDQPIELESPFIHQRSVPPGSAR